MIVTSEHSELKETTQPSRFRVEAPATNPMMPTASVSLVKEGDSISLHWDAAESFDREGVAQRLASELLSRTQQQVEKHPSSSRVHTNMGIAFLNCGDLSNAISEFNRALEIDSANYVAGTNLAKVYTAQGKFDEAEDLYRRLQREFPDNITPLMGLAFIAMRRDQYADAEKLFRDAVARRPATPVPFYHLAILLLGRGEAGEAIRYLRTAVRHNVRSAALYQALGVAYSIAGENDRSAKAFKTALTLSPNLNAAQKALANVLLNAGQTDAAIELLASYLDKEPDDREARMALARAYMSKQRYPAARAQFTHVLASYSSDPEAANQKSELSNDIGVTFFRDRELREAEASFRRAISYSRTHGTLPYRNLAEVYTTEERYSNALEVLAECRHIFGDDEYMMFARGAIYGHIGEYDRAISELQWLVSRGTKNVNAYATLTWLLSDVRHDYEAPLTILMGAIGRFPNDLTIANNLAYVYLMLGQKQDARPVLERVQSKLEGNVALTATWGLLYLKEGNQHKARELYQAAAQIASQLGNKKLAATVRQKMHLEFARDALRRGDILAAAREVEQGLRAEGRADYKSDLLDLQRRFQVQPSNR